MVIDIRVYQDSDFDGVDALWREAFPGDPPWNHAHTAVPAKRAFQPDLFFVAADGDQIIGSVMAGYDGHRGWLYAVAVSGRCQRKGIGARLIRTAEAALHALGCAKVNLQVRSSNDAVVSFYEQLGYAVEPRISLGRRLNGGGGA